MYDNFLTEAECDYFLNISGPLLEPAMLVDSKGQHFKSPKRSSRGAFFDRAETDVVAAVDARIAHVTQIPPENAEPLQVMQYLESERYTGHVDYYRDDRRYFGSSVEKFGGQRIMTALLYLTTAVGGETVFPRAAVENIVARNSCTQKGAGVRSVKGRLVVFHNIGLNGAPDPKALHESCPVIRGTKTVISRFIRSHACPLNKNFSKRKWNGNVACVDDHLRCAEYKAQGDCTSSDLQRREFMVGNKVDPGFCERTCGVCTDESPSARVEPSVEEMRIDMLRETAQQAPEVHEPVLGRRAATL